MDLLPDEVLLCVLSYLHFKEICKCCLVCQRWNRLCNDKSLWRTLCLNFDEHSEKRADDIIISIAKTHPTVQELSLIYMYTYPFLGRDTPSVSVDSWKQFQVLESFYIGGQPFCELEWLPVLKACGHTLKDIRIEGLDCFKNEHFHLLFTINSKLRLRELSLAHCKFLGAGMFNSDLLNHVAFKSCLQCLETLDLDGIRDFSDTDLCKFLVASPQLRSLTIDGECLTDSTPENISLLLLDLKKLSISFCESLTDKALTCFAQLTHLESLSLKKCPGFTNEGFEQFAKKTPVSLPTGELVGVMKHLSLIECPGFNDDGLSAVVESFQELIYLDISWCYHITDLGIHSLSTQCRKIETLIIVGLYVTLVHILDNPMPTLRVLDLTQTHLVDDSQLHHLKAIKPWLEITDYYGQKINGDSHTQVFKV